MRHRSKERPPERKVIDSIVKRGAAATDEQRYPQLLRRLRNACFLNDQNQPLLPQERLISQYRKDGLVLFLGAGTSKSSGIPNWPELAGEVLQKSGIERRNRELDKVKKALPSYIAQFELAALRLGSKNFVRTVYEALYAGRKCAALVSLLKKIPLEYSEQKNWSGWREVLRALQENATLRAIGDLLIIEDNQEPRCNPQIHGVVTFNADNLLELYCQAKTSGRRLLKLVDRASVGQHPDTIPVYHLHGFLDARGENLFKPPRRPAPGHNWQKITNTLLPDLIFRESDYYETIANPRSFINHTPQSFLRSLNALFIGTSLDDLNMRRWLHDSFRERVRHRTKYLREFYEERFLVARYDARLESRRHFWLRTETERDELGRRWRVPQDPVQLIMGNLGVELIWCSDYDGVSRFIDALQERGRNREFGRHAAEFPS